MTRLCGPCAAGQCTGPGRGGICEHACHQGEPVTDASDFIRHMQDQDPAKTDWPYDADRDDPLTALRIPVVASFNPRWCYVAALVRTAPEVDDYLPHSAERPTDAEAAALASFIQEYVSRYREGYQRKLAEKPLDVDGGRNTVVFIKYGPGDWGYRSCSWVYGHTFVPSPPTLRGTKYAHEKYPGPLTLEQVMDLVYTIGDEPMDHWVTWKADHPDVFGGDQ